MIKLTLTSGEVYVNPAQILYIGIGREGGSVIYFASDSLAVKESPQQIVDLLSPLLDVEEYSSPDRYKYGPW